jgi:hypothetical protein
VIEMNRWNASHLLFRIVDCLFGVHNTSHRHHLLLIIRLRITAHGSCIHSRQRNGKSFKSRCLCVEKSCCVEIRKMTRCLKPGEGEEREKKGGGEVARRVTDRQIRQQKTARVCPLWLVGVFCFIILTIIQ